MKRKYIPQQKPYAPTFFAPLALRVSPKEISFFIAAGGLAVPPKNAWISDLS
jgi:hypothetical protein